MRYYNCGLILISREEFSNLIKQCYKHNFQLNTHAIGDRGNQYVLNLYKNVLDRLPDNQGFNYWLNQIEKGYENRSDLLMGFSESVENKAIFSAETNIF